MYTWSDTISQIAATCQRMMWLQGPWVLRLTGSGEVITELEKIEAA